MKRCIIFGASGTGKATYKKLVKNPDIQVVAFADNDKNKHGMVLFSLPVISPDEIKLWERVDSVVVASLTGEAPIYQQLIGLEIEPHKIDGSFVRSSNLARLSALNGAAELIYEKNVPGAVAELGVFQGEFAKEISRLFPDRKLYLFDTFEGFDERDIASESGLSNAIANELNMTTVDMVMDKIPNKKLCVVKKGYFPQTAEGLDETFAFVNLDPDLYQPVLSGLRYFYPRLSRGGIIFIHDYFNEGFLGVKKAVQDFQKEQDIKIVPIGDDYTIAVVK